jgi:hypothetical protein
MTPRIRRRAAVTGRTRAVGYVRFVLKRRNLDSGMADGVFEVLSDLEASPRTALADHERLRELGQWFDDHLPSPGRRRVSKRRSIYGRNLRTIAWFKDTATECISRMRTLAAILEKYGHRVGMIHEDRIGSIVYEDEFQVVAEPFADTKTESE